MQAIVSRLAAVTRPRTTVDAPPDVREALERVGVPKRYLDVRLHDLRAKSPDAKTLATVERVAFYIANLEVMVREGRGLVLAGQTGRGKTSLSVCVLRALIELHVGQGQFATAPGLHERLNVLRDTNREEWARLESRLVKGRLLVLDDLGAENLTAAVQARWDALVTDRYNEQRSLIVTTNLTPKNIAQRYGERILSRLAATCDVVTFVGPDLRGASA